MTNATRPAPGTYPGTLAEETRMLRVFETRAIATQDALALALDAGDVDQVIALRLALDAAAVAIGQTRLRCLRLDTTWLRTLAPRPSPGAPDKETPECR